jgi:predicted O-methyltransferase YrrM
MDHDTGLSSLSLANVSLKCRRANRKTLRFLKTTDCRDVAEIGVYRGRTSIGIARYLNGRGVLRLFDFKTRVVFVKKRLAAAGFKNVRAYGCTSKLLDSYNWPLMKLLQINQQPIFDYVFIDGAHSWAIDGFTFLLVDRLLRPGGYVDFDDYNWTIATSESLNPKSFPHIENLYSKEQTESAQVKLIVDILVRRDSRYREVVPNKIFQKA